MSDLKKTARKILDQKLIERSNLYQMIQFNRKYDYTEAVEADEEKLRILDIEISEINELYQYFIQATGPEISASGGRE